MSAVHYLRLAAGHGAQQVVYRRPLLPASLPSTSQSVRKEGWKAQRAKNAVLGLAWTRGERSSMQDAVMACTLPLPTLPTSIRPLSESSEATDHPDDAEHLDEPPMVVCDQKRNPKSQTLVLGIFDGHGRSALASSYLATRLSEHLLSSCSHSQSKEETRGAALEHESNTQTLAQTARRALLDADSKLATFPESECVGSTASVAFLQFPQLEPLQPFYAYAGQVDLLTAQLGDSRILIRPQDSPAQYITPIHHARAPSERRRIALDVQTDAFGEERYLGQVENTRAIGDFELKTLGVIAEPEIRHFSFQGSETAFMALVSDGISSLIPLAELSDLIMSQATPHDATQAVISYAEQLGVQDNATVLVIPFAGWEQARGRFVDRSAEVRKQRVAAWIDPGSGRHRRQ